MPKLIKEEIIAQACSAASKMLEHHGYTTSAFDLMGVLELNSRLIEDEDEIEGIQTIIALGGATHLESSNNQMCFSEKYIIGEYMYSFTSFNYGPDVVHETLLITEEDFLS